MDWRWLLSLFGVLSKSDPTSPSFSREKEGQFVIENESGSLLPWKAPRTPIERRIVLDTNSKTITTESSGVARHRKSRTIPFDRVEYIDYDFEATMIQLSNRQEEEFTVSLVCRDPRERVAIAAFRGVGMSSRDFGVRVGEIEIDGLPGEDSREFVEWLRRLLDVPVGPPVPHGADAGGVRYRCSECGQNSPPNRVACQYCGGTVEPVCGE